MQHMIEVENVRRVFRSVKKKEGLKGAIGLLLKPEYQEHEALKGVSFTVPEGEFVGLIGANGAGKTTLLKILSGLIPPSSGTARVLGIDPFTRPMEFRRQISLVMGQKAQLWWDLPGIDAFDLLRAIYQVPPKIYRERLAHLAELLGVKEHLNTQIRRLSLGERMKMELIGAILHWPKVLFLDEPTIGLDVLAASKLRDFLKHHHQSEKATIVLTSHNMEDIARLCSRILLIRSGELIYDGSPVGLTRKEERRLRLRFDREIPKEQVAEALGIAETQITYEKDEEEGPGAYFIDIKQEQILPFLQIAMARFGVTDMGIEEPSLERVIQRIYENHASPV